MYNLVLLYLEISLYVKADIQILITEWILEKTKLSVRWEKIAKALAEWKIESNLFLTIMISSSNLFNIFLTVWNVYFL